MEAYKINTPLYWLLNNAIQKYGMESILTELKRNVDNERAKKDEPYLKDLSNDLSGVISYYKNRYMIEELRKK